MQKIDKDHTKLYERILLRQQIEQIGGDSWIKVNTELYDATKKYVSERYAILIDYIDGILNYDSVQNSTFTDKIEKLNIATSKVAAASPNVDVLTRCNDLKMAFENPNYIYAHDNNGVLVLCITLADGELMSIIDVENDFNRNYVDAILSLKNVFDALENSNKSEKQEKRI